MTEYFNYIQTNICNGSNQIQPIQSLLIKPVQRMMKYSLLLKDLKSCLSENSMQWKACDQALKAMMDVPKRANDASHLKLIDYKSSNLYKIGLSNAAISPSTIDESPKEISENTLIPSAAELILQMPISVHPSSNQITKLLSKTRERHLFLFESILIIAKKEEDFSIDSSQISSTSSNNFKYTVKSIYPRSQLKVQGETSTPEATAIDKSTSSSNLNQFLDQNCYKLRLDSGKGSDKIVVGTSHVEMFGTLYEELRK